MALMEDGMGGRCWGWGAVVEGEWRRREGTNGSIERRSNT